MVTAAARRRAHAATATARLGGGCSPPPRCASRPSPKTGARAWPNVESASRHGASGMRGPISVLKFWAPLRAGAQGAGRGWGVGKRLKHGLTH
jgi:hypothetical protein